MEDPQETDVLDKAANESLLDAFGKVPHQENHQVSISPANAFPTSQTVGAQPVAVRRDERHILQTLKAIASAAGGEFFYRFPVRKKGGGQDWIEGPSIKLANELARVYGNCEIDTRVFDVGDSWLIYARFTDFETGFSMVRPFQQRKSQRGLKGDDARGLDIALQIGVSKSIRNVVCNALQTFADFTFDEARGALVDKIGKDLNGWREKTIEGLKRREIEIVRVEAVVGRASKDWLAPDVARVIAMMKSVADGMSTIDETFPALDKKVDAEGDGEKSNGKTMDNFAKGEGQQAKTDTATPTETSKAKSSGSPATAQTASGAQTAQTESPAQTGPSPGAASAASTTTPPKTEKEYVAHANAWRESISDPVALKSQWDSEKNLRNGCNVSGDVREDLKAELDKKIAKLAKG